MFPEKHEKLIQEFLQRLKQAAGQNLESVVLFGSAAGGEFHPEFSNLNMLLILGRTSFAALRDLAPTAEWWNRQQHAAPLILTRDELVRSADVFSVEWLDMKQNHRVLFGDDPVTSLQIPMHHHRAQVEYELREKLILLRQGVINAANNEKRLWVLLLLSVSSFGTLFRHALIASGEAAPQSKREAGEALASRLHFDGTAFSQLLDVRELRLDRKQLNVDEVCTRYLAAIEQATSAVDTMLDSAD